MVSGSGWADVSEYLPLLSHLPCHCVAWSVQRQCQFPTSLLHTTSHTHTHSHSLYQFAFVSISVCCADGSTNSVTLVRSSQLLSHCQVKSLNLQGTTTAVLCCVPTLTHSRLLSHDQLPQRALNRYNHNPSFYLCCVCACVCYNCFPTTRLSTWKVQRQFQLV